MMSNAKICIIPVQDYLGLDDTARINTPSTSQNNWRWRLRKSDIDEEITKTVRLITDIYGRKNADNLLHFSKNMIQY